MRDKALAFVEADGFDPRWVATNRFAFGPNGPASGAGWRANTIQG
jgi:hypothetical protein